MTLLRRNKRNRMLKRIVGAAAALLVLSALNAGTALAQGRTWAGESLAQKVEAARWKLGVLRLNGSFELLNFGYDGDVYYGYLDHRVPDFTLSAGLPIQLFVPASKNIVLEFIESPQYMFYLDTKKERAWNNRFTGRAHIALERIYIQAGVGLSDVHSRLSPELNVNIREKINRLDGLVLWQVSRQMSLAAIYGGSDHDFGDADFLGTNIAEALNRKEHVFDLATYLQPNPRVRFSLDGQYGNYVFPEETGASRDAQSYGVFGGFELIPREGELVEAMKVQGNASLGYVRLDMKDPQFVDGSGLSGAVNLSVEFMKRTRARVFFSRGFQFSVYSGARYYFSTIFGGGITRYLSRRAFVGYDLSFGRTYYPTDTAEGSIPTDSLSRYTTHTGSLEIRLARNVNITFLATLGRRALEETGSVRKRIFCGFNLTYGSPVTRISAPIRGVAR